MLNRHNRLFNRMSGSGSRFEVRAGTDETTVYIYQEIGKDWYGDGISAIDFIKELNNIKKGDIHLHVNSPGGDVFEAKAIAAALRDHPSKVVAHIDGIAASSATFLVMAADEIRMSEGAFFMIHNAWGMVVGNAGEMRGMADVLEKIDASIRADYSRKTGLSDDEISAMMAAETWMNSDEALEKGFVDIVDKCGKKTKNEWDLSIFDKVPAELLAKDEEKHENEPKYDFENMKRRLNIIHTLT